VRTAAPGQVAGSLPGPATFGTRRVFDGLFGSLRDRTGEVRPTVERRMRPGQPVSACGATAASSGGADRDNAGEPHRRGAFFVGASNLHQRTTKLNNKVVSGGPSTELVFRVAGANGARQLTAGKT
jgi:hypothetical protein